MKKVLKILFIVLLIIAIAAGALAVWQWNNIKAVITSVTLTSEEIDDLVAENDKKTKEILNELTDSEFYPLTEEQQEMLLSGELTKEEALEIIKNGVLDNDLSDADDDSTATNGEDERLPSDASKSQQDSKDKNTDKDKNTNKDKNAGKGKKSGGNTSTGKDTSTIDDIISRIYLTRAQYSNALVSLESEARSAASAIPKKERTISNKLDFVNNYTGRAVGLEAECDGVMEGLLGELSTELKKTNGDLSIISDIRSVYSSEKSLKKSQLLSKYGKYL